ncbi:MAG TPA: GxxExxY protein [Gemmatimonadaceae bacterium]|nr:GxxExxY protein [Gemmatimonadaceae bacterium]
MFNAEGAEDAEQGLINRLTDTTIGGAVRVHSELGPGLLESAYIACLAYELRKCGFDVQKQVTLPVKYDSVELDVGYRIDLLVNDAVIVEVKALANVLPVHEAQLLSYLRLSQRTVGLLINFHVERLKDGIRPVVNNYIGPALPPRPPRPPR